MPAVIALADRLPLGQVRAFLAWWGAELAAMLPATIRERTARPRADIRLMPDAVIIERVNGTLGEQFVDTRRLAEQDEESWTQLGEIVAGTQARFIRSYIPRHCPRCAAPPDMRRSCPVPMSRPRRRSRRRPRSRSRCPRHRAP